MGRLTLSGLERHLSYSVIASLVISSHGQRHVSAAQGLVGSDVSQSGDMCDVDFDELVAVWDR